MSEPLVTEGQIERATDALREHDPERMECMDHDGECCPAGDAHDMTRYGARRHQAQQALLASGAVTTLAAAKAEALREALAGIKTHNGQPLSPTNLRWAATHEALCRSFIFDVLTGLADALTADQPAEGSA